MTDKNPIDSSFQHYIDWLRSQRHIDNGLNELSVEPRIHRFYEVIIENKTIQKEKNFNQSGITDKP